MVRKTWGYGDLYTQEEVLKFGGIRKIMKQIRLPTASDRTDQPYANPEKYDWKSEKYYSKYIHKGRVLGWQIRYTKKERYY